MVTGFLSFGLWVHHMYATGLPELALSFFAAASLMIAIASGTQVFAWIATLWGRPGLRAAHALRAGLLLRVRPRRDHRRDDRLGAFDWQVHDTYFIVAHFHYVLIGGVVFPIFAGMHYWLPKITGRMLDRAAGHWSFWLFFVGFNVTFFPMHFMGFFGHAAPRLHLPRGARPRRLQHRLDHRRVPAACLWRWTRPTPLAALGPEREEVETRSGLPVFGAGPLSVGWWGTITLLAILGMALAVMAFAYFYLRLFADAWPMGGLPLPPLAAPLAAAAVLAGGLLPLRLAARRLRDNPEAPLRVPLAGTAASGVAFLGVQLYVLISAGFGPSVNAYASVFFVTHFLTMLYVLAGVGVVLGGLRHRRAEAAVHAPRHLRIATLFWAFVAASGAVTVAVLHVAPYLI
jgi:heme/copper-type cytochrome/quinol oxidase subunit 3